MNSLLYCLGLWIVFCAIITKSQSEIDRVKIIVPHKINYIHHHHRHHRPIGFPKKPKKSYYKTHLKTHHIFDEDDFSQEDFDDDAEDSADSAEETDATKRNIVYYAIPAAEFSQTGGRLSLKPILLYRNDRLVHRSRHVKRENQNVEYSTNEPSNSVQPANLWSPFASPQSDHPDKGNFYRYNIKL